MTKHFPKGLDDRQRDANGGIRPRRGDTRVATFRETYGDSFLKGHVQTRS